VTKKNRRGRGVVAGTPSSGSGDTEQASQSTTEDREQTPFANGGSTLHRDGALSRIDVRLRHAYEPGWYRVLASEPAELSVRKDPLSTDSAESADPEPTDHTAPDRAGSRS
jgi:hypothetical protein